MIQNATSRDTPLPFVFDGDAAAESVADMLNEIAEHAGSKERIKASFATPDVDEVKECFKRNCTLWGILTLSPEKDGAWKPVEIPVLYPYHGVFVMGNGNGRFERPAEARLMVWHPCLVRRPGLWLLRRYSEWGIVKTVINKQPGMTRSAELSFHDGTSLRSVMKEKSESDEDNDGFARPLFLMPCQIREIVSNWGLVPELGALKEFLSGANITHLCRTECQLLLNKINLDKVSDTLFRDDDDLETKRLFTYQVFVIEKIVRYICSGLFAGKAGTDNGYWKTTADGQAIGSYIRKAILSPGRDRYAWMRPFNPRNAAEAVSDLTALSRHGWGKSILDRLPPQSRQNHPSFFGRICPVQTPESEMIGLSLHLAAGAGVGRDGTLKGCSDYWGLGYAAALLPFYQHTDAARAMMGAKNYAQALPVKGAEKPHVTTGMERVISEVLRPLTDSGLILDIERRVYPGRNLLVAYMPYFGLNYNDAVVASESLVDLLAVTKDGKCERNYEDPDFEKAGQNCLSFGKITDRRRRTKEYVLGLGDKLTGRHGNKGVVAAILPPDKMPRLPVDERLGELSGRAVDLVLNPLGVISRMNIGQLLESHAGLLMRLGAGGLPEDIGRPFSKVDADKMQEFLLGINGSGNTLVDGCGRMRLTIPFSLDDNASEVLTECPVVVGFQYFVRLDHIPEEKVNFRGGKPDASTYDRVTGQAVRGRCQHGGQKLGLMDFWALEAYGAESIIKRVLTDRFRPQAPEGVIPENESQTFRAIRDWLYSVGFTIDGPDADGGYRVGWAKDEEIKAKGVKLCYANNTPEHWVAYRGRFACPKPGCCEAEREAIVGAGTLFDADSGTAWLCVEDLLRIHKVVLRDCDYNAPLSAVFELAAGATIRCEKQNHLTLSINGRDYPVYARTAKKDTTLADVLRMPVSCSRHTIALLVCETPEKEGRVNAYGGLADPATFRNDTFDWGYIELPEPWAPSENVLGSRVAERPAFGVIPVLPLRYRKGFIGEDGEDVPDKLSSLYEDLAAAALGPASKNRKVVQKAADRLFAHLKQRLEGKDGLVRKAGLGRRIDNSGRFVVVPDPNLAWDECGVPAGILAQMYPSDSKLRDFAVSGGSRESVRAYQLLTGRLALVNRAPTLHRYNIKALRPVPIGNHATGQPCVLSVNPLVCVSMGCDFDGDELALYVLEPGEWSEAEKMLPTDRGNLLSLANGRPVAEFDQDMVLGTYLIFTDENLRAEFVKTILFDGCETCTAHAARELWDADACADLQSHLCRDHSKAGNAGQINDVADRITEWMRMAFNTVTLKGVSFGYFDLESCVPDGLEEALHKIDAEGSEDENGVLADQAEKRLNKLVGLRNSAEPGFHVAAMVLSRARGEKQIRQVVAARGRLYPGQLCFSLGSKNDCFKESLLGGMVSPENSFWAAMNGRSSMTVKKLGTQRAGSLTNSLVSICWPWRVEGDDCGFGNGWMHPPSHRTVVDCQNRGLTVCRKCYGTLPDGSSPQDDYPAGLVAAQSIGERGTQLSMKVAHSGGGSEIDIDLIRGVLNDMPEYINHSNPNYVCDRMKELGKYDDVEDLHFHMLAKAIGRFNRKGSMGISVAESALTGGNLFNALAKGGLWKRLPAFIGNDLASPAKTLTADDMDRILDNAVPSIPDELEDVKFCEFLSRPDLKEIYFSYIKREDAVVMPTSSPVARILVGNAGTEPEPEANLQASYCFDERTEHDLDDEDGQTAESEGFGDDDEAEVPGPEDVTLTDDDGDEDPLPVFGDLPTGRSRIAIVVTGAGKETSCKVETSDRSKLNSNVSRLACLFAEWAEQHPDLLCRSDVQPPFDTQDGLLNELLSIASSSEKLTKKDMTEFAQRGVIYWDSAYLPVRALCRTSGRRWSCKRASAPT